MFRNPEAREAFREGFEDTPGVAFVLEHHHEIVRIADDS